MRSAVRWLKRRLTPVVFSEPTFRILCRLLGPTSAGRLCARFIEPDEGTRPACLCITRDVFIKDVTQLRARTERAWPAVSQGLLYLCEQAWIPRPFFEQTKFQARLPGLSPSAVEKAERFAVSFLRHAQARHGVGAVLTGNPDYAPDEFIRRAARRERMPFLVLAKEHANTEYGHRVFAASLTGYKFHGDAVAVFGPRTKTIFAQEGVCPPDRMWITGPPRFDEWFGLAEESRRDVALLFAFSRDYQDGSASFPAVLQAFLAAAEAAPDGARFVVKCRDPDEEADVRDMVSRYGDRLEVTWSVPVPDLLRRSFAAVGFCSLAMAEALLSPATVVCPRFAECRNDVDAQFDDRDPELRALVRFPRSPNELTRDVLRAAAADVPREELRARERIVHRLFCEPRPTYSRLVDEFVDEALRAAS